MLKMALNNNLIFYNFFVHKNLSPYVSSWSACINSALSFFLIGFIALTRLSHIIVSVLPMTNWKDSSDGWKDSRHSGQLMAALFSWKRLSYLSSGIQYMFSNSKLPKPVRMPQMAGKTPQSWLNKLTTTVPRWWSICCLQIYFSNFFCLTKALQISKRTKRRIVPTISNPFLTDIFWKELSRTIQLLFGTFCDTNVRCFLAVCYFLAGFTPQSRFFDCTIPGWCFQNLHFMNYNVLFAFKRLDFDFIGFINLLE